MANYFGFIRISGKAALGCLLCLGLPSSAQTVVNVLTHRYDNQRTGANQREFFLTPANVNESKFGKLYAVALDGQVFAQPLYVYGVPIPGQGKRNVLYVATVNNSVYALDVDDGGRQLWKANFGTPVVPLDVERGSNITHGSHVGILGTPVIDPVSSTIYFVSRNEAGSGATASFAQYLNALDITTGRPRTGSPARIQMTFKGVSKTIAFDPRLQNQRAALTLANGLIYVAWASHDDLGAYHGWVASFRPDTLALVSSYVNTPNGTQGGIWQAGHGLTVDAAGNILFSSGNGTFGVDTDGTVETGNSFVKLSPSLKLLDYFTPMNSAVLNSGDQDLGSTGLLSIPGTNLIFSAGKQGRAYLVDSTSMGHFNASVDHVKQEFQAVRGVGTSHLHGAPIYWNSQRDGPVVYLWGENDVLRAFALDTVTGQLNTSPIATSTMTAPMTGANGAMPGGFLSISSNGNTNGIVWASTPYNASALQATVPGVLHAFDATTLVELWTDKSNGLRDEVGNFAKNVSPVVANGKVFVPNFGTLGSPDGSGNLNVYGLLNLIPNGRYTLKSVNSNLLLNVPGGSTQSATVLDQAAANGLSSQIWEVTNLGANVVRLTNVQSGMDVDVSHASKVASSPVIQYPYHGASNQQWRVTEVEPGVYTLMNLNSGFLLDVAHNSQANGGAMDQYPPNLSWNQYWTFQLQ